MLYAYWYVKKLRSRPIGLKTQKMSLTIIKFIGDELISDKSIFGFRKFRQKSRLYLAHLQ